MVHPRSHPGAAGDTAPRSRSGGRPTFEPDLFRAQLHPLAPGRSSQRSPPGHISIGSSLLIPVSAPRGTLSKSSTSSTKPKTSIKPTKSLGRFADLYATGQIPEYHDTVDTIINWGDRNTRLPHQQTSNQRTHRRHQQPPPESYEESPTASPTTTITQPEESL